MSQSPLVGPESRAPRSGAAKTARPRGVRPSSGRVTLKDVARLAGVSAMTVSRVINRPETVTPEVGAAVRKAIARTGYVPDLLAGALASSRTRLVAAVVPTIAHAMFAGTVQSFTDRLAAEGYQMLLGLSGYPETREDELVRAILSRRPDALFLTGTGHSAESRRRLRAAKVPIVETWDLARQPIDMAVGFSHAEVGRQVADFLHAKGHRRFAVISADDERATVRRTSYAEALAERGIADIRSVMVPAPTSLAVGRSALSTLFAGGFAKGAVYCNSDALAQGVLIEAQARGLAVPGDLAVVGFGDLEAAAYTAPPLTTVHVDRFAIGRLAAEAILARLAGRAVAHKVIDVGFEIVERDST
jgi:LacI family gluconate utilization system Gnt-I transcriptional repressor